MHRLITHLSSHFHDQSNYTCTSIHSTHLVRFLYTVLFLDAKPGSFTFFFLRFPCIDQTNKHQNCPDITELEHSCLSAIYRTEAVEQFWSSCTIRIKENWRKTNRIINSDFLFSCFFIRKSILIFFLTAVKIENLHSLPQQNAIWVYDSKICPMFLELHVN